jgi:hypothetical protein
MTMRSAQSKEKLQAYGLQQLHPAQTRDMEARSAIKCLRQAPESRSRRF